MQVRLNVKASRAMLTAALEGLTAMAFVTLATQKLPPLYRSGVRYEQEPLRDGKRQERWLTPDQVYAQRWGDCEDLAAWRAAELRQRGIPARAVAIRTGAKKFHAVVRWPDGSIEDPSRLLGMGKPRSKKK